MKKIDFLPQTFCEILEFKKPYSLIGLFCQIKMVFQDVMFAMRNQQLLKVSFWTFSWKIK